MRPQLHERNSTQGEWQTSLNVIFRAAFGVEKIESEVYTSDVQERGGMREVSIAQVVQSISIVPVMQYLEAA